LQAFINLKLQKPQWERHLDF